MTVRVNYQAENGCTGISSPEYELAYQKMKALTLGVKPNDLVRSQERIIEAGQLGTGTDGGVINPGALYQNNEFLLLCRGEQDDNTWAGDCFSSKATPIWCIFDRNLALKRYYHLHYDRLPLQVRPEDWRLFEYQGRLYTNHSLYLMKNSTLRCLPSVSEIDIVRQELNLQLILQPPFKPSIEEKNWGIFAHGNALLCIYSFRPYVILEIDL